MKGFVSKVVDFGFEVHSIKSVFGTDGDIYGYRCEVEESKIGDFRTKTKVVVGEILPETYVEITPISDSGEGEPVRKSLLELRSMTDIAGLYVEESSNVSDFEARHYPTWHMISHSGTIEDCFWMSVYSMTYAEAIINESVTSEIVGMEVSSDLRLCTDEYMMRGSSTIVYGHSDLGDDYNGVFEWSLPFAMYNYLFAITDTSIGRLLLSHAISLDKDNKCELLVLDPREHYDQCTYVLRVKYYVPADVMVRARGIFSDKLKAVDKAIEDARAAKFKEYISSKAEKILSQFTD